MDSLWDLHRLEISIAVVIQSLDPVTMGFAIAFAIHSVDRSLDRTYRRRKFPFATRRESETTPTVRGNFNCRQAAMSAFKRRGCAPSLHQLWSMDRVRGKVSPRPAAIADDSEHS